MASPRRLNVIYFWLQLPLRILLLMSGTQKCYNICDSMMHNVICNLWSQHQDSLPAKEGDQAADIYVKGLRL